MSSSNPTTRSGSATTAPARAATIWATHCRRRLPFRVYRLDPATGQMTIAVGDMKRPNGLAFSPDEKLLYVIDTPGPGQRTIQVYDVLDNGTATANRREFNSAEPGGSDGMRVDVYGNLWCGWSGGETEDGVAVFAPDGKMIGRIMLPERCANVCFGGRKRNRLFMAASQSVYSVYVETQGAVGGVAGGRRPPPPSPAVWTGEIMDGGLEAWLTHPIGIWGLLGGG